MKTVREYFWYTGIYVYLAFEISNFLCIIFDERTQKGKAKNVEEYFRISLPEVLYKGK